MQDTHLCRICLIIADRHLVNMVKEDYNGIPYLTIYTETVGRKMTSVEKSGARICSSCEIEMLDAYKFRKKCLYADEKVKNVIKKEPGSSSLSQHFVEPGSQKNVKNQPMDVDDEVPGTSVRVKLEGDTKNKERKRKLRCKVCRVVFTDFENFQFHKCMSIEPTIIKNATMNMRKKNEDSEKSTIVVGNHEYTCRKCRSVEVKKVKPKEPKDYVCDLCGKNYVSRSSFGDHMRSHRPPVPCPLCNRLLKTNRCLTKHMEVVHKEERNYPCPFCERTFTNNALMRKHAHRTHPNDVHHLPTPGTVVNTKYLLSIKQKFNKEQKQ